MVLPFDLYIAFIRLLSDFNSNSLSEFAPKIVILKRQFRVNRSSSTSEAVKPSNSY